MVDYSKYKEYEVNINGEKRRTFAPSKKKALANSLAKTYGKFTPDVKKKYREAETDINKYVREVGKRFIEPDINNVDIKYFIGNFRKKLLQNPDFNKKSDQGDFGF